MSDLRVCRICLSATAKMYKLDKYQLKSYYEEVMAVKFANNDSLPQYFCYECATLLHKFHKFKEKCYCGQKALKEILWRAPITYDSISRVDRAKNNLSTSLGIIQQGANVKSYSYLEEDDSCVKFEKANVDISYIGGDSLEQDVKDHILTSDGMQADEKSNKTLKKNWQEEEVMSYSAITNRRTRFLNAKYWKKYILTELEALREFQLRSEAPRYLKAAFKCSNCYRGFSKEEMLLRHMKMRHSESLGMFSCRFCHMRFKWDSHLRIHMRQHFVKYKCLRCHFVCPLENSAILHEEYHSGVTRKCLHCGEQFRHASTYYSHLRSLHRSRHVCVSCGATFVSEVGLHQHRALKHQATEESPDDEELNTYCDQCDIRFETSQAYREHVFQSDLHADGLEHELRDELAIPRKVLGKRLRAKITKELNRKQSSEDQLSGESKRKKRIKRKRRKPTTCHQCGKHFDTQLACMKHHISEHPRTSFYPAAARHICEICGASLAPGSVAVHQNMHTKSKVFPCDTCGKTFHSGGGLNRHLVTHTGEKRFACTLCDKRFTQSNSMKLHYRTFHLKQPYPKRNRNKKDHPTESVEDSERSELESLPDIEPESLYQRQSDVEYLTLQ